MIYTKIKMCGKTKIINVDDLEFFSLCPDCGCETEVPLYDWLSQDIDVDGTTSVYCDDCSEKRSRERIVRERESK